MATLLQSIKDFIDKITVTDRQEENIASSVNNLTTHLLDKDNNLAVDEVFTTGSWERDTIIRPLNDVDLFAVLERKKWEDDYGQLPTPQSVLTKLKNFLNGLNDYKDKVKQDRPCVTIVLSDKNFDVMPAFDNGFGGYYIPNHDLSGWTNSSPKQLEKDLNAVNRNRSFNVKPTIKAVKSWNRDISKLIPSYHIEEVAISIFQLNNFSNNEQSIRLWFDQAEYYLTSSKFKSHSDYDVALKKVKKVKEKLNDAKRLLDDRKESEAKEIWKDVFGKEFPITDEEEAKNFSKAMQEGTLKVGATGILSTTVGKSVQASGGFYGEK
jgi:hypothetical protein